MSLLFEDLFKRLNAELKRQADMSLAKANRASQFDITKYIRADTITYGLESAISSGNWNIKRFRMDRKGVTQVLPTLQLDDALIQQHEASGSPWFTAEASSATYNAFR